MSEKDKILNEEVDVMKLINDTISDTTLDVTDIGYLRRSTPVIYNDGITGTTWMMGILALIPSGNFVFKAVWPTTEYDEFKDRDVATEFSRNRYKAICKAAAKKGWRPFPWKDDGLKSPDGAWRLLPFVKDGFDLAGWIKSEFGADLSHAITISNSAKILKYLGQKHSRNMAEYKALVIPADLMPGADGCAYTKMNLFPDCGDAVKIIGIGKTASGKGAINKGMMLQRTNLSIIPKKIRNKIKKANPGLDLNNMVIMTTDTMKFADPWNVYETVAFWHDDSSRNITTRVTVPSQLIREAPLSPRISKTMERMLDRRVDKISKAAFGQDRSTSLPRWAGGVLLHDVDPNDATNHDNLIAGDVATLGTNTGLPLAFGICKGSQTLMSKLRKGICSFIRNRSMVWEIPGVYAFVVYNPNLSMDGIKIPRTYAEKHNIKIGDTVVTWKSPLGPRSSTMRKVEGFLDDNHIEVNAHYNFDFDGDKVSVTHWEMIRFNVEIRDHAEFDRITNRLHEMVDACSEPVTPKTDMIEAICDEFEVQEMSKKVGLIERGIRSTIGLNFGVGASWMHLLACFQEIEEGILIKGKKHGCKIKLDINAFIKMAAKDLPRPNFHKLLCNRKNTEAAIKEFIEDPQFAIAENHEAIHLYKRGFEVAKLIDTAFKLTNDDIARMRELKTNVLLRYRAFLNKLTPEESRYARYNIMNPKGHIVGHTRKLFKKMGAFYGMANNHPEGPKLKAEFRIEEKAEFDEFTGSMRTALLAAVLYNEVYAWIYHFSFDEIKKMIDALDTPPDNTPEDDLGEIHIHTDGASKGNPGPAGIGYVIQYKEQYGEFSDHIGKATNNQAELIAIKAALSQIKNRNIPTVIYSDSEYSIGVLTGKKKAKANRDLINEIRAIEATYKYKVQFLKVKGHSDNKLNNKADELASESSLKGVQNV